MEQVKHGKTLASESLGQMTVNRTEHPLQRLAEVSMEGLLGLAIQPPLLAIQVHLSKSSWITIYGPKKLEHGVNTMATLTRIVMRKDRHGHHQRSTHCICGNSSRACSWFRMKRSATQSPASSPSARAILPQSKLSVNCIINLADESQPLLAPNTFVTMS